MCKVVVEMEVLQIFYIPSVYQAILITLGGMVTLIIDI